MADKPEIRNEEILLISLCRLSFTADQKEKIHAMVRLVNDWDYFVMMANEHGVAALVMNNINQLEIADYIPHNNISLLTNAQLLSISRNAFHLNSTAELLSLLNKEGIKVVLLKGMALELTVYGNSGLRQMTDVDILIDRGDYIKARKILMDNGYDSLWVKSWFHELIIEWTGKHLPSMMKNGTSVDIHLRLFAGKKNNLTKILYDTSLEITLDKEKVYIPSPQLFFLFLIKHLHSHEIANESQLRMYTDLVVLIEKYGDEIINPDLLLKASEAGISDILALKLELLQYFWDIQFPGWVDEYISKYPNPDFKSKFIFFLKSPRNNKQENPGFVYRHMIKSIPGLHRKVLFVLGDLFPTMEFMKNRYGVKSNLKAFIFYPVRLGKLLWLFRK